MTISDATTASRLRLAIVAALLPLLFLMAAPAVGDDEPEEGERATWTRTWVVKPKAPLGRRVAFVLDASGSMHGPSFILGQHEISRVLSLFSDDGYIKVYSFGCLVTAWRKEWTALPDAEAVEEARGWMAEHVANGITNLGGGVAAALSNEHPELAVILVSDGEVHGAEAHLFRIHEAQSARKAGPVPVHCIGVDSVRPSQRTFLTAVAKQWGGGYLELARDVTEVPH